MTRRRRPSCDAAISRRALFFDDLEPCPDRAHPASFSRNAGPRSICASRVVVLGLGGRIAIFEPGGSSELPGWHFRAHSEVRRQRRFLRLEQDHHLGQARLSRPLYYAVPVRVPSGDRPLPLAFGSVAGLYDRVRPSYSLPLLDRAEEALQLAPGSSVLDLAAGTGRLTRELVKRFAEVFAVEPDDRMRALIDVGTVFAGTAEAIPVDAASAAAVFVGEAFHWFDPTVAIREIARVLRPHGGLAVISTHWWETEPPVSGAAIAMLREAYDRSLDQRRPPWQNAFEGSSFEPLRSEAFEEEMIVDPDTLLALYSTTSSLAALEENRRGELLSDVRPYLNGRYRLPIKHELIWTRLS